MDPSENKPDIISKMTLYGTTYEIREYFDGNQTLEEIITRRILRELNRDEAAPQIPDPEKA